MAQERGIEYNVPVTSFQTNQLRQGIMPAGRYRGFDSISNPSGAGLNIQLDHTNGLQRTDINNAFESDLRGLVVAPQGTVISTDVETTLPIDDTPGNRRIDIVVMTYEYSQVTGGTVAVLSIVTGTPATNNTYPFETAGQPALPNPEKQVLIGVLDWQESSGGGTGVRAFSDATYWPAKTPNFNGYSQELVLRGDQNRTIKEGGFFFKEATEITGTAFSGANLTLPEINENYIFNLASTYYIQNITFWAKDFTSQYRSIPFDTVMNFEVGVGPGRVFVGVGQPGQVGAYPIKMRGGKNAITIGHGGSAYVEVTSSFKLQYKGTYWELFEFQESMDLEFDMYRWYQYTMQDADISTNLGSANFTATSYMNWNRCGEILTINFFWIAVNAADANPAHFEIEIPSTMGVLSNTTFEGVGYFSNNTEPEENANAGGSRGRVSARIYNVGGNTLRFTSTTWNNFWCNGPSVTLTGTFQCKVDMNT